MTTTDKLTAEQIDGLCMIFDEAKFKVEQAQQELSRIKGELLAAIQSQGYAPANADKTTRLEGVLYVADATVATTVEINEPAVGELQAELSRMRKPRVFAQLFDTKTKHSLKKEAAGTLKLAIGALADEVQKRLLGIFASCFKPEAKAPAVSVDLVSALRAKEAEAAAKAEKKAAREAKKKGGAK